MKNLDAALNKLKQFAEHFSPEGRLLRMDAENRATNQFLDNLGKFSEDQSKGFNDYAAKIQLLENSTMRNNKGELVSTFLDDSGKLLKEGRGAQGAVKMMDTLTYGKGSKLLEAFQKGGEQALIDATKLMIAEMRNNIGARKIGNKTYDEVFRELGEIQNMNFEKNLSLALRTKQITEEMANQIRNEAAQRVANGYGKHVHKKTIRKLDERGPENNYFMSNGFEEGHRQKNLDAWLPNDDFFTAHQERLTHLGEAVEQNELGRIIIDGHNAGEIKSEAIQVIKGGNAEKLDGLLKDLKEVDKQIEEIKSNKNKEIVDNWETIKSSKLKEAEDLILKAEELKNSRAVIKKGLKDLGVNDQKLFSNLFIEDNGIRLSDLSQNELDLLQKRKFDIEKEVNLISEKISALSIEVQKVPSYLENKYPDDFSKHPSLFIDLNDELFPPRRVSSTDNLD